MTFYIHIYIFFVIHSLFIFSNLTVYRTKLTRLKAVFKTAEDGPEHQGRDIYSLKCLFKYRVFGGLGIMYLFIYIIYLSIPPFLHSNFSVGVGSLLPPAVQWFWHHASNTPQFNAKLTTVVLASCLQQYNSMKRPIVWCRDAYLLDWSHFLEMILWTPPAGYLMDASVRDQCWHPKDQEEEQEQEFLRTSWILYKS